MEFIVYIILLLVSGCLGGLMAGMLGVGGGVILTPIQYFLLTAYGVDPSTSLTVSFATSLAVICVTMINGTYHQYRNGYLSFFCLKEMMLLGFIGAVVGAFISTRLDVSILRVLFGIVCLFSAVNMIFSRTSDDSTPSENVSLHILLGLIGGLLCGLMGVGGGVIMIPFLMVVLKYPTHRAIATSSATIIATTLGGLIAYIVLGWNVTNLPAYSLGYVNLLQFFFLTLTSTIVAGYAARLSRNVDSSKLKFLQVCIVLFIAFKMIGIV